MCLIAWNWQPASATPLLLLSNRDEFYARPTLPLHWWEPAPNGAIVLAGRDLQADGTWLGVNRSGRLAALTNYRSATPARTDSPSRGELVAGFLQGTMSALGYLQTLRSRAHDYNPFNLLVFDGQQLLGLESRQARILTMSPGLGAVSNADFHTPWPKLTRLQHGLHAHVLAGDTKAERVFALLHDTTLASDDSLPETGVPVALEQALSATFVATPGYGTRACSVVHIHQHQVEFAEQSFGLAGLLDSRQTGFSL
ncbi:MAG: NRDE family protein [Burkholderiales bacterium]|nr:NRDE family protein [Burkholderiales bacterium]